MNNLLLHSFSLCIKHLEVQTVVKGLLGKLVPQFCHVWCIFIHGNECQRKKINEEIKTYSSQSQEIKYEIIIFGKLIIIIIIIKFWSGATVLVLLKTKCFFFQLTK